MGVRALVVSLSLLGGIACAPRSDVESLTISDDAATWVVARDGSPRADGGNHSPFANDAALVPRPPPPRRACDDAQACGCSPVSFTIDTKQSCSLSVLPGYTVDAEGFITIAGENHRVFAMNRWGAGHIIGWGDTTTLIPLLGAFEVARYLGQTDTPRVASMGYAYLCDYGASTGKVPATYLGLSLPEQYVATAGALARDWDVLIFCGYGVSWDPAWRAPIQEFVSTYGKGLLAAMDYEGAVTANDFASMSEITSPSGIVFNALNLPWAPTSTTVALDCVRDVPPPLH
jgi:hypothetical protein